MDILRIGGYLLLLLADQANPIPHLTSGLTPFISITIYFYLLYSIIAWQRLLGTSADLISPSSPRNKPAPSAENPAIKCFFSESSVDILRSM
jgi:hypothetical protein